MSLQDRLSLGAWRMGLGCTGIAVVLAVGILVLEYFVGGIAVVLAVVLALRATPHQNNRFRAGINPEKVGDGSRGLPDTYGSLLGQIYVSTENVNKRRKHMTRPDLRKLIESWEMKRMRKTRIANAMNSVKACHPTNVTTYVYVCTPPTLNRYRRISDARGFVRGF